MVYWVEEAVRQLDGRHAMPVSTQVFVTMAESAHTSTKSSTKSPNLHANPNYYVLDLEVNPNVLNDALTPS